jgi:hypothetical protein
MNMRDYEKLVAYRIALKFIVTTIEIRDPLPKAKGELVDQFQCASFSIVLNIAEDVRKLKPADKQCYFLRSTGSVTTCGALFDLFLWQASIHKDWSNSLQAMHPANMTPSPGTFTFTRTCTSTSGQH